MGNFDARGLAPGILLVGRMGNFDARGLAPGIATINNPSKHQPP